MNQKKRLSNSDRQIVHSIVREEWAKGEFSDTRVADMINQRNLISKHLNQGHIKNFRKALGLQFFKHKKNRVQRTKNFKSEVNKAVKTGSWDKVVSDLEELTARLKAKVKVLKEVI